MAIVWQLRLKDVAGALVALFDEWPDLRVERTVNAPDAYALRLSGDNDKVALFDLDGQLEGWYKDDDAGIAWHLEFEAFTVDQEHWTDKDGSRWFLSSGPGYLDLLNRTLIHTYAGHADSIGSGVGETVIKAFVNKQVGPGAGARARAGLAMEADAAAGANWDGQRSNKNVLELCQEIARMTGVQIKCVGTGAATFEFQVDVATDRTATVIFSEAFGNMAEPHLRLNNSRVRNWIKVGGQGQGVARTFVTRSDAASIALSTWNQREAFKIATDQTLAAQLNSRGDEALAELEATQTLTFRVLQTPGCRYGVHYFLGDEVTAIYAGTTYTKLVNSATWKCDKSGNFVDIGMIDA